ncbi:MAG: hypothetical protein M3Y91_05115 [Actinomycetota bacterium]|nr:hypothetical protein [Actinomycetota bacterium]
MGVTGVGVTGVECRYRTVLRLLPRWYRAEREDEMVATFLEEWREFDDLDLEYRWPPWSETASVASSAVRLRLGGTGAPARSLAWGEASRLVALLGLLAYAALTVLGFASVIGLHLHTQVLPTTRFYLAPTVGAVGSFIAVVVGYRRAAKLLGAGLVVVNLVEMATQFFGGGRPSAGWLGLVLVSNLPVWVPVLALVCSFHAEAPPVRHPHRWLVALPAGTLALVVIAHLAYLAGGLLDVTSLVSVALVVGAVGYLLAARRQPGAPSPAWPLALAVGAAVLLVVSLATIGYSFLEGAFPPVVINVVYAQTAMLTAVGLTLAVTGTRSLRRLPHPVMSAPADWTRPDNDLGHLP